MAKELIFRWHESSYCWLVLDEGGHWRESFHDCPLVNYLFSHLDKNKDNIYDVNPIPKKEKQQ